MSNDYEENARTKKVDSMVAAIDRAAHKRGWDIYDDAGDILSALEKYTEKEWTIVDKVARLKNKSSDLTRFKVKENYKERKDNAPF